MEAETLFSISTLGCFFWVVRFVIPKAIGRGEPLALACTALGAVLALLLFLLVGIGAQSAADRMSTPRFERPAY